MNTDTRQQRFIPCTPTASSITAISISPNLKSLAVAEAPSADGDTRACISVYDLQTLKRRKTLSTSETGNAVYVDLHFSSDSRMLLAQSGAPDWTLLLWSWEKAKVSSSTRTGAPAASLLSVRFAPGDSGLVSVLGTNFLRILRCVDSSLKPGVQPLTKRDPQEFLSQVCALQPCPRPTRQ
jgi:cilia- and flagella-associated protein 57